MSMIRTFDDIENKHDVYRGEVCLKKFCESLRKHTMKIINFEKKKIILLTNEQQESYEKIKICCICKNILVQKYTNDKNIANLRTVVIR